MDQNALETLAGFLAKTFTNLVAQNVGVAILPGLNEWSKTIRLTVNNKEAEFILTDDDAQDLWDNPIADYNVDLLELIAQDLDITMDDIEAAENYYAFRDTFAGI